MTRRAAFGKVVQIRDFPSQGVTRLSMEFPIEIHKQLTNEYHGTDALVSVAPKDMVNLLPYGMVDLDRLARGLVEGAVPEVATSPEPEPAKKGAGPRCRLAAQWCKENRFQEWLAMGPLLNEWTDARRVVGDEASAEVVAATLIRGVCSIDSRAELDRNPEAAKRWDEQIRIPFMQHCGVYGEG